MKIGLLTLVSREYNYGGLLQQYALFTVLNRYGEVEIIDYDLDSEKRTFSLKRGISNFEFKKLKYFFEKYKKVTVDVNNHNIDNIIEKRKSKIDKFRFSFLDFSENVDESGIEQLSHRYNYIFCGSDQIWNPEYNVPSFFLAFSPVEKNVIYSASVGKRCLTHHQKKIYEKYIENLNYVSVREREVLTLFSPKVSSKLQVTLDPTLLLSEKDWLKIKKDPKWNDYIFCYFLGHTESKIDAIKKFAQKYNKKIIAIPYLHRKAENDTQSYADIQLSEIGPQEFLGLIFNAACVITDSFHACVFSLMFNKCFYVFSRHNGSDSMDSRIETLLGYYDIISDRLISPNSLINKEIYEVKYKSETLLEKVNESIQFIEHSMHLESDDSNKNRNVK